MNATVSKTYSPTSKQMTLVAVSSAFGLGLGVVFLNVMPAPYGYAMFSVCVATAILNIASIAVKRLSISNGQIISRRLLGTRTVDLSQVENWKIRGDSGGLNTFLEITKVMGDRVQIQDITSFGVVDHSEFSGALAKAIRAARPEFR